MFGYHLLLIWAVVSDYELIFASELLSYLIKTKISVFFLWWLGNDYSSNDKKGFYLKCSSTQISEWAGFNCSATDTLIWKWLGKLEKWKNHTYVVIWTTHHKLSLDVRGLFGKSKFSPYWTYYDTTTRCLRSYPQ